MPKSIFTSGWLRRSITRVECLALVISLLTVFCPLDGQGDDQQPFGDGNQRTENGQDSSLQELLEFLGQWETADGEWVDPGNLDWLIEADRDVENNE